MAPAAHAAAARADYKSRHAPRCRAPASLPTAARGTPGPVVRLPPAAERFTLWRPGTTERAPLPSAAPQRREPAGEPITNGQTRPPSPPRPHAPYPPPPPLRRKRAGTGCARRFYRRAAGRERGWPRPLPPGWLRGGAKRGRAGRARGVCAHGWRGRWPASGAGLPVAGWGPDGSRGGGLRRGGAARRSHRVCVKRAANKGRSNTHPHPELTINIVG